MLGWTLAERAQPQLRLRWNCDERPRVARRLATSGLEVAIPSGFGIGFNRRFNFVGKAKPRGEGGPSAVVISSGAHAPPEMRPPSSHECAWRKGVLSQTVTRQGWAANGLARSPCFPCLYCFVDLDVPPGDVTPSHDWETLAGKSIGAIIKFPQRGSQAFCRL